MADDLSEWGEIAGMIQEALGAEHDKPATWFPPANFNDAINKIRRERDSLRGSYERAIAVVEAARKTLQRDADFNDLRRAIAAYDAALPPADAPTGAEANAWRCPEAERGE